MNSLKHQVKLLEELVEQQQAMLNFKSTQHNIMVNLGINREKEINRLQRKLAEG